jgi:hypothetical protein
MAADSGGSGGNKSKKRARLFELDMSTTMSDRILEPQREREGRIQSLMPAEWVNPHFAHAASKPPAPGDGGGGDAPKVAGILKKEGGGRGGRRRAAAARCRLTGKITNKHLARQERRRGKQGRPAC